MFIVVLSSFLVALLVGLLLTPVAAKVGKRFGAVDAPNARKVHSCAIPRTGGMAIMMAFFLGHFVLLTAGSALGRFPVDWGFLGVFWAGAFFASGIGITDDFRRVPAWMKLLMQILAATMAFLGGVRIGGVVIMETAWHFPLITSYLFTVFWFILLINAINLIDGLDGLAAGVTIFSATVMTILLVAGKQEKDAVAFAALAGGTLGFLKYNFNPAKVFMGDGGSYFLGYALAFLSVRYGTKSQTGLSLLIPFLALGVPIFDVMVSVVRRFITGRKIFQADKGHIHHKLLAMGLTIRKTVLILYGTSGILALSALLLIHLRSVRSGIILFLLGTAAIIFVRKIGYFEYLASDKLFNWLHDLRDVAGLTRSRRTFLGAEMDIMESENLDEMWRQTCAALEMNGFDSALLVLINGNTPVLRDDAAIRLSGINLGSVNRPGVFEHSSALESHSPGEEETMHNGQRVWRYTASTHTQWKDIPPEYKFEVAVPLLKNNNDSLGILFLVKNLQKDPITFHTMRRIESLRRSLVITIAKLEKQQEQSSEVRTKRAMAGGNPGFEIRD